jgi:hypothetical protein
MRKADYSRILDEIETLYAPLAKSLGLGYIESKSLGRQQDYMCLRSMPGVLVLGPYARYNSPEWYPFDDVILFILKTVEPMREDQAIEDYMLDNVACQPVLYMPMWPDHMNIPLKF